MSSKILSGPCRARRKVGTKQGSLKKECGLGETISDALHNSTNSPQISVTKKTEETKYALSQRSEADIVGMKVTC